MQIILLFLQYFFPVTVLVLALKFLPRKPKNNCKGNLPPSPPSLPYIGHLHIVKLPFHKNFHALSKQYGPIFTVQLGSQRAIVVSSLSAAKECFNTSKTDIILANRPHLATLKQLNYDYTMIFSANYGQHWRNVRRIYTLEIFSSIRLNNFLSIRNDVTTTLLHKLSRNTLQDFARVKLKHAIFEMSVDNILRMVVGRSFKDDEEARDIIEVVMAIVETGGPGSSLAESFPVLGWIDFRGFKKRMKKLVTKVDKLVQGLVDEHRSSAMRETSCTMLDNLLSLQKSEPEYYTDEIIKGMILALLLGTDPISVTLEWTLSLLLNNPKIMEKLKAELDTHIGQERLIAESDIPNLPYLQCVIWETFRLKAPVPLLVPHMSSEDWTLSGYNIPSGSVLWINAWAIHRDPKLWDDPTIFRPERFENPENYDKLIPFGLGRRSCPGSGLARRLLGLTLGSLIQCFDWNKVGEEEVDLTEGSGILMTKVVPLEPLCRARPILKKIMNESS